MPQTMADPRDSERQPCPECQGDGVPCTSVHVACAECGRSAAAHSAAEGAVVVGGDVELPDLVRPA
jgi:hypothetical protein